MRRAKKKPPPKRKASPPRQMRTEELCKSLVGIAGLQITDEVSRNRIYEAVRRLQVLDAVAIEVGILPK